MWKNNILLIFIFFALGSPSFAGHDYLDSVTYGREYPPGSHIVKYGGLRGRLYDEIGKRLGDIWDRYIHITAPNSFEYFQKQRQMEFAYEDLKAGGKWWTRSWLWSLPENKGGAPNQPLVTIKGLSTDLFRVGPIYVDYKLKLKLHHYQVSIYDHPAHQWKLKIKPKINLGIRDLVRCAKISVEFIYSYWREKLLAIELSAGWKVKHGGTLEFLFSLLRW